MKAMLLALLAALSLSAAQSRCVGSGTCGEQCDSICDRNGDRKDCEEFNVCRWVEPRRRLQNTPPLQGQCLATAVVDLRTEFEAMKIQVAGMPSCCARVDDLELQVTQLSDDLAAISKPNAPGELITSLQAVDSGPTQCHGGVDGGYCYQQTSDDNIATYWHPANGNVSNEWIVYALGGEFYVDKVSYNVYNSGDDRAMAPKDFRIEYCNGYSSAPASDGYSNCNWVSAGTFQGQNLKDGAGQEFTLSPPIANTRFLRAYFISNHGAGDWIIISEFDAFGKPKHGKRDPGQLISSLKGVSSGPTGCHGGESGGYCYQQTSDDNIATYWHPDNGNVSNEWIVYDLDGDFYVDKVSYNVYNSDDARAMAPKDFRIEYCHGASQWENCNWMVAGTFTGQNLKNGDLQEFAVDPPIQNTRFIRAYFLNNHGATDWVIISEFDAYGEAY